jgi:hypothetical protein
VYGRHGFAAEFFVEGQVFDGECFHFQSPKGCDFRIDGVGVGGLAPACKVNQ